MLNKMSKDKWIRKIKLGMSLEYVSTAAKEDFDVVLAAVKKDGLNLKYAGAQFKINPVVVKAAISQNYKALEFVHSSLKKKIVENGIGCLDTEDVSSKEESELDQLFDLVSTCETDEDLKLLADTLSNYDMTQVERLMIGRQIIKLLNRQIEISKEIEELQQKLLVLSPSCDMLAVFPINDKGEAQSTRKKFVL